MARSAMIRARIEPKLKEEVEAVLAKIGLSTTDAINLFYQQIKMRRGIPFDVVIPNKTTRRTLERSRAGKDLLHFDSPEEMFAYLKKM
jgi:DNA-damage-inducible protein J